MFSFPVLLEQNFFVDDTYVYNIHEYPGVFFFFRMGHPIFIPGNTGVYDLVTLGRVIWVIDTIRTRLHVRAHTLTRADCSREQLIHECGARRFSHTTFTVFSWLIIERLLWDIAMKDGPFSIGNIKKWRFSKTNIYIWFLF